MNTFARSILLSLALSIAFQAYAQAPAKELNIIKRQYRTIKDDVRKVQQCYFSKSKCSQEERKEAQKALGRLSAKTVALIGMIVGIGSWGYFAKTWQKRTKQFEQAQIKTDQLATDLQEQKRIRKKSHEKELKQIMANIRENEEKMLNQAWDKITSNEQLTKDQIKTKMLEELDRFTVYNIDKSRVDEFVENKLKPNQ